MRSTFRPALHNSLPCVALLAAATALSPDAPAPADASDSGMAATIHVQRGHRRFTLEDIPAVVRAVRRLGYVDFICWIDPHTGNTTIEADFQDTPHFDIKPGECPNNLEIEEVSVLRTGVLGNAFDVTQVDLGSLGLFSDLLVGEDRQVDPIATSYGDPGTPFDAELCDCHAVAGDDVLDVIADFDRQEVIDTFGLDVVPHGSLVPLRISGMLQEGRAIFSARDCVKITNHSN
jgi:hypothetical protein